MWPASSFPVVARPSIVDLSLPLTTLTESRLASNSFASTSRLDQPPGGATLLRGTHLGFGQGQKRQSRAAQLPNARSSTLLQASPYSSPATAHNPICIGGRITVAIFRHW